MGANGKVRWGGIHEKERMERREGSGKKERGREAKRKGRNGGV